MSAWADRKAAVQAEAEANAKTERDAVIADQHAALAEKPEDKVLAELDLPNPDNMQAGDDFSVFMKATVPAALRNRALRKLWTSDPVLANVDMLVDYGEDFTGKNDVLTVVKTLYRVGKGLVPDKEELPQNAQDPVAETTDATDETVLPEENTDLLAEQKALKTDDTTAKTLVSQEAPIAVAPRRRMQFVFAAGPGPVATETEIT